MVASHGKSNLAPKVASLRREKYKTLRALLYDKKLRIAFHKAAFPLGWFTHSILLEKH